jgi:hypothetical protein
VVPTKAPKVPKSLQVTSTGISRMVLIRRKEELNFKMIRVSRSLDLKERDLGKKFTKSLIKGTILEGQEIMNGSLNCSRSSSVRKDTKRCSLYNLSCTLWRKQAISLLYMKT